MYKCNNTSWYSALINSDNNVSSKKNKIFKKVS